MSSRVEIMLDARASVITLDMGVEESPETVADDLRDALEKSPEFVWYGSGANRIMFRTSSVVCIEIKERSVTHA